MVMTSGTQSIRRACRMMKRATNRTLKTKNHKVNQVSPRMTHLLRKRQWWRLRLLRFKILMIRLKGGQVMPLKHATI
jgi:hypothetical protein